MAIKIITYKKRPEHMGGVAKHAAHLQLAFPDATHYVLSDLPTQPPLHLPEWEKARILNIYLINNGLLTASDTIIVDGFWSNGIPRDWNIITIVHGTFQGWYGYGPLAQAQKEIMSGTQCIAVSENSAREARNFYGIDCERVILNGIETDFFKQMAVGDRREKFTIAHANKNSHILRQVYMSLTGDWFEVIGYPNYDPNTVLWVLQNANLFLHPTDYEGNAYSLLEAMSCDVPVLTSKKGLFADISDPRCGISLDNPSVQDYIEAVKMVAECGWKESPREWVLENATLEKFIKEWREYVLS